MPIASSEKARAKRRIMKIVEPTLRGLGFAKAGGAYALKESSGRELRLLIDSPSYAPKYRVYAWVTNPRGEHIGGPDSEYYERLHPPDGIRFDFRFHLADDTHSRCADNIVRWVLDVAMPWFQTMPSVHWSSPQHTASAGAPRRVGPEDDV
jgi:hypothetical protein